MITVYSLSELPEEVRAKVMTRYRGINIKQTKWYMGLVEGLQKELTEFGITFHKEWVDFSIDNGWLRLGEVIVTFGNENLPNDPPIDGRELLIQAFRLAVLMGKTMPQTDYDFIYNRTPRSGGLIRTGHTDMNLRQIVSQLEGLVENDVMHLRGDKLSSQDAVILLEASVERLLIKKSQLLLQSLKQTRERLTSDEGVVKTLKKFCFTAEGNLVVVNHKRLSASGT